MEKGSGGRVPLVGKTRGTMLSKTKTLKSLNCKQAPTGLGDDWMPSKCLPTSLLACLIVCLRVYLLVCLLACLLACLSSCLLACQPLKPLDSLECCRNSLRANLNNIPNRHTLSGPKTSTAKLLWTAPTGCYGTSCNCLQSVSQLMELPKKTLTKPWKLHSISCQA